MNRILLSPWLFLIPVTLATAAPPQNPQVEKSLRDVFDKWDLNHDGFLDRDELAKHFRGPKAVAPEGGAYDEKGNASPLYEEAHKKYPDLIFLWSMDKDGDDRLSWSEFEKYGQQYAAALKQQSQAQPHSLQQSFYGPAKSNGRSAQQGSIHYVHYVQHGRGQPSQQAARNAANMQRQAARAQQQMMQQYRSAMQRQMQFYRMAAAQRRRWLQQFHPYSRHRRAYAHRMVIRHSHHHVHSRGGRRR